MSEPCPPAFIRTAPPIEPGTPTAHSNPVRPRTTPFVARRPEGGRPPHPHDGAVGELDLGERVAEGDGDAGEAAVGDQQVRAPATTARVATPVAAPPRPGRRGRPRPRSGRTAPAGPHPVGGQRTDRHVASEPGHRAARRPPEAVGAVTPPLLQAGQQTSSGSEVMSPAPEGEAQVAGSQLVGQVRRRGPRGGSHDPRQGGRRGRR